jgi:hypothetical protein
MEINMTKPDAVDVPRERWPLARLLIFMLAGAFAGLVIELRVEHVDAVRERGVAWLPIVYSGVMTAACGFAFVFWSRMARLIMIPFFLLALIVGSMGFWFHNHGDLKKVVKTSAGAWTDSKQTHSDEPPQFAPLAFAGLGGIGILASLKRFNP